MKIITRIKNLLDAEKRCKDLEEQLTMSIATNREKNTYINKLKSEIKVIKRYVRDIKKLDKKQCERRMDKLNYLVCRLMDIDFYSNVEVFQTKFERGKNWRNPITTYFNNLELFQKDYLMTISNNSEQVREFIEILYSEELNTYQEILEGEKDDMKEYGIKYAPHKCLRMVLGDCTLDMKTCSSTYDECIKEDKKFNKYFVENQNESEVK